MRLQIINITLSVLLVTTTASSQTAPPVHSDTVPIYHVTVVDRTVSAVNYQYKGGPTQIDFKGTVLSPKSKGDAIVESKSGRTEIEAKFERLTAPQSFGAEYLTYVLWAITPDGHPFNLGEIVANGSDNGQLRVTTELQAFGLIVTAEPYSAVKTPSDVVLVENAIRPDTIGSTEPIHARVELLPRGTYTYNVPAQGGGAPAGPKVSMSKYEQIVGIYQAQNAIQIARAQGASQYAPELMSKAEQQLATARQLEAGKGGRSAVVSAAREAAQTAEDARILTASRKQEAEVKQAQNESARHQQQLEDAEARVRQAEAQARADREALEAERARQNSNTTVTPAPPPPPPPAAPAAAPPAASFGKPQAYVQPASTGQDRNSMMLRAGVLRQLNSSLGGIDVLDAPRGIVAIVPDVDFEGNRLSTAFSPSIARVAQVLSATKGLRIEVDGYSDLPGEVHESIASARAQQVRDALISGGISASAVVARSLGSGHPLGPDRDQNRRVEIVISGSPIGTAPLWDRSYTLTLQK